ncbi:MAG TPA: TerB family tellurite resistance protein [Gemmatimonadales bacterium]|nr:TerB family tellurite resistance protein [Gemmatimonadales bacterium]
MLAWLAELPPVAVYLVLALLAAVENVVPPVPADAVVLLGAFLSHRGVISPLGVFLVVWLANVAGALAVYVVARRYGRRLFASPRGRRLLAPPAIAVIEREYLRFGLAGIFFARFLPGIRAVVPPFAGLVALSPLRAGVPVVLASAVWYGAVTILGTVLGAQWEQINAILAGVNRTLGFVALVVAAAWAGAAYLRARRRRRERVWAAVTRALGGDAAEGPIDPREAAMLVLELAYADEALTREERALVEEDLRGRWGLEPAGPAPAPLPEPQARSRFAQYRERIVRGFGRERRIALVEGMWQAAFQDGAIGVHENRLMERAGELLGLSPAEIAEARRRSLHRAAGAQQP